MEKVTIHPPLYFLLNSLRGIGYSLETAIADLVDNSVAAQATMIEINFIWNQGNPYIAIVDDGTGMSDEELISTLNLAVQGVDAIRNPKDLGRFGLGLKTASFSQCRILSVVSKKNNIVSSYCWDLNALKETPGDSLFLLKGPHSEHLDEVKNATQIEHGTIVIWEDLDKAVTLGTTFDQFCKISEKVKDHLAMVFHRFLERRDFSISMDGQIIKPWNPFPIFSPTNQYPIMRMGSRGHITASGFILPHKDYFPSEDAYVKAGGKGGWISHQGFYIYRNDRLLVAGSWLGLGEPKPWIKDELHVLARIQVDITSEDDFDWGIDVKKSTASPPIEARLKLQNIGFQIREKARNVYVYRGGGKTHNQSTFEYAWIKEADRYRVNRNHSIIREIIKETESNKKQVSLLLKIIEESVPVERIWLDTAEQQAPIVDYTQQELDETIGPVIKEAFDLLIQNKAYTVEEAIKHLNKTEPFSLYPTVIKLIASKF